MFSSLPRCGFIFCIICCVVGYAQESGALSEETIHKIQQYGQLDAADRVLMNALTNNMISDLVVNRGFIMQHNDFFSHVIDTKGITDQERSGRCWLFAALNVLRPKMIAEHKFKGFEFSQAYLFFWDKIEKSNRFLEHILETADRDLVDREVEIFLNYPITDGGYWSYVVNLVNKYGMIPKTAMPETHNTKNSWPMNDLIARKLRIDAHELRVMVQANATPAELRDAKIAMLGDIYRMLVFNFGEPPEYFLWRYETTDGEVSEPERYSPVSFYRNVVGIDLNDYIPLMHYPGKDYYKYYCFEKQRNIYEGYDPSFINVDITEMRGWAMKSVLDDEPVYFACDIVPDKYSKDGILSTEILDYRSLYGIDLDMPKKERILYRESASNHAMVFVGVDVKDGEPVKWLVEDSHGSDEGHNGYWTMYNDWLDEYVYVMVIHKKYVPAHVQALLKDTPVVLPLWDPMAAMWWERTVRR